MDIQPDSAVVIMGVAATAALIRSSVGIPIVAIDDTGNMGIQGEVHCARRIGPPPNPSAA